jgi:hypothetical protein
MTRLILTINPQVTLFLSFNGQGTEDLGNVKDLDHGHDGSAGIGVLKTRLFF